jgi:hypothetical protein
MKASGEDDFMAAILLGKAGRRDCERLLQRAGGPVRLPSI